MVGPGWQTPSMSQQPVAHVSAPHGAGSWAAATAAGAVGSLVGRTVPPSVGASVPASPLAAAPVPSIAPPVSVDPSTDSPLAVPASTPASALSALASERAPTPASSEASVWAESRPPQALLAKHKTPTITLNAARRVAPRHMVVSLPADTRRTVPRERRARKAKARKRNVTIARLPHRRPGPAVHRAFQDSSVLGGRDAFAAARSQSEFERIPLEVWW